MSTVTRWELSDEERAECKRIVDAPYNNGGVCPYCPASGSPEPDDDWHSLSCPTQWAKRVLKVERDIEDYAAELAEHRANWSDRMAVAAPVAGPSSPTAGT